MGKINVVEFKKALKETRKFKEITQSIKRGDRIYTSVSELLRLRKDPLKIYSLCNENQLCMIDENGNIIKA